MDKEKTGQLIKEARIKKGYTQAELGDLLDFILFTGIHMLSFNRYRFILKILICREEELSANLTLYPA